MVEVIRKKYISYYSDKSIFGIFVFKKSNRQDNFALELPILYLGEKDDHFFILKDNDKIELISYELNRYCEQGDILEIDNNTKTITVILSSLSNENTLLLTEQCENRCIFCSQPPNLLPDIHLYQKAIISILNFNSKEIIGLTGGEPTINKNAFIGLLKVLNNFNNSTPLHILTNGRNLGNNKFFNMVKEFTQDRKIIWGIPLYGYKSSLHDAIVGANGAFKDTLHGLLNLSITLDEIELRIVVVKQNYKHIKDILEFVNNNFPTISIISLMKLEPVGLGRENYDKLYISIKEQNQYLSNALTDFNILRFDIKLLNYPKCLLNEHLRKYSVKSISDWKNYYPDECNLCLEKENCCGYFSSSVDHFFEKPKAII